MELCTKCSHWMCWYLTLVQALVSFVGVSDSKPPIVWVFKFNAKPLIKCVGVHADCQQLNVRVVLFTFQPGYLKMCAMKNWNKKKLLQIPFYWSFVLFYAIQAIVETRNGSPVRINIPQKLPSPNFASHFEVDKFWKCFRHKQRR